ncbi:MAG: hypothetical protein WA839_15465 [Flavobacteriaceae bacterium]
MLSASFLYGQKGKEANYARFVDSANFYIDDSSAKALSFLDSIPKPLEKTISGRLADYYYIMALAYDYEGEYVHVYQSYILALKYGEKEKNYLIAGNACLELFANIYFAKRDTLAYVYLEKAEKYYKLDNYANGLLEIEQMRAYVKFLDGDYKASNALILTHLDAYRKVEDDAYFHVFAMYMLTANYIELGDFKNAYASFKELKSLKDNPTIVKYNYFSFEVAINLSLAQVYFSKKQLDSTEYYLSKSTKHRNFMGEGVIKDYLALNSEVYKYYGNIEQSKVYLDSLMLFEKKMFNNMVDASIQLNTPLMHAESELEFERNKKYWNGVLAVFLFCMLSFLSIFYIIYYRKQKFKQKHFKDKVSDFSYLRSTNEKLTGKIHGLEEYIGSLKKDIKEISTVNDVSSQREKIKELYKELHINSSTLLDKSESHLELVNDLNIQFFNQIHKKYPQLNDSEVITCYYLFMGFKNKEIALFLNTSIRALESKRYRISKKIDYDFDKNDTTLVKHLKKTFKNTQVQ